MTQIKHDGDDERAASSRPISRRAHSASERSLAARVPVAVRTFMFTFSLVAAAMMIAPFSVRSACITVYSFIYLYLPDSTRIAIISYRI